MSLLSMVDGDECFEEFLEVGVAVVSWCCYKRFFGGAGVWKHVIGSVLRQHKHVRSGGYAKQTRQIRDRQ